MAAQVSMENIGLALAKRSTFTLTVKSVRFLIETHNMPYHYDDFFKQLLTKDNHAVTADGAGARKAVEYLWNRLDKAGMDLAQYENAIMYDFMGNIIS